MKAGEELYRSWMYFRSSLMDKVVLPGGSAVSIIASFTSKATHSGMISSLPQYPTEEHRRGTYQDKVPGGNRS